MSNDHGVYGQKKALQPGSSGLSRAYPFQSNGTISRTTLLLSYHLKICILRSFQLLHLYFHHNNVSPLPPVGMLGVTGLIGPHYININKS